MCCILIYINKAVQSWFQHSSSFSFALSHYHPPPRLSFKVILIYKTYRCYLQFIIIQFCMISFKQIFNVLNVHALTLTINSPYILLETNKERGVKFFAHQRPVSLTIAHKHNWKFKWNYAFLLSSLWLLITRASPILRIKNLQFW